MDPIKPSQDVVPLSSFRANVSELLKQAQKTGRPIVITQHGRGAAVLISTEGYEELLDRLDYMHTVSRALVRLVSGKKGIPHDEVMADARALVNEMKKASKAPRRARSSGRKRRAVA